jgi:hypothetical protein
MQLEHAEHTLETIRTLMERSQRYAHLSGYSGLVAGTLALTGSALPGDFLAVWTSVFVLAFAAHCAITFGRARRRGEPAWTRQARTVSWAVLPALLAGVTVSAALTRLGRQDLLPALWLVLYGCGALATSFFAPRSIAVLGAVCLTLGIVAMLVLPDWPRLTMAVGFGLTHVAFGVGVLVAERREQREAAFWASVEQFN